MENCEDAIMDDQDLDEADDRVSNPPPSFPLELENDGKEFQLLNPRSCSFCGKFFH